MDFIKVKNEKGLELTVTTEHPENYQPIMGGDNSNHSWEDYLKNYKEEYQPHILLVREALEKLNWIGDTGEQHSNDTCFVFSDGNSFGFSWRAWGDLMQAIVDKNEGYMQYYM